MNPEHSAAAASDPESHAVPRSQQIRADVILLATALIWGSAFVAQRSGMEQIGPFAFNAARFALGGLVLLPIIGWRRLRAMPAAELRGGALLGLLVFAGASCQQIGLVTTTASKAGFITGLYVVIVPLLLALVWRDRIGWLHWGGAVLSVLGLFLLSLTDEHSILQLSSGDIWELAGAFGWALQVIAIGRIAPGRNSLRLALLQYAVCALLSAISALALETTPWNGFLLAGPALLYAGFISTGLAYTGQIIAQRHAPPTHAAILMSLEAVFAALFGWLLLKEQLTGPQLLGCGLMLAGMLLSQMRLKLRRR